MHCSRGIQGLFPKSHKVAFLYLSMSSCWKEMLDHVSQQERLPEGTGKGEVQSTGGCAGALDPSRIQRKCERLLVKGGCKVNQHPN